MEPSKHQNQGNNKNEKNAFRLGGKVRLKDVSVNNFNPDHTKFK